MKMELLEGSYVPQTNISGRSYNPPTGYSFKYVLHVGETSTGKTFQAIKRMKEAGSRLHLAPPPFIVCDIL